ncbi:MAG TPA: hypothetical protein P5125_04550 [Kiritimatiellia bacterium]|nr:hypothetical protein [Kiritimatiellia bacterium]HPC49147.1 hypothetical protein [Kiritimatiellia bacterium]HRU19608.1 hypothetical protein [Kiritimatiellia bacterium]
MRPRCQWAGIAVALILIGGRAESKTVNVFFVGGQSNAKAVWATAIAEGLKAGYGSSLVMAHTNHSGEGLANWFTDTSKINYSNDLFHLNGTSVLQTRMAEIAAAGDEPVFRGDVPAGVSGVQAMVIFRTGTVAQPSITNGTAFVDDLRVTVFEPVWPPTTLLKLF